MSMAVDYFHRLVVWGADAQVQQFVRDSNRRARYRVRGEPLGRTDVIPLSFEALWKRRPGLRRLAVEAPADPYQLSAWRRRVVRPGLSFVRYQFQTRSMEMQDVVRFLSLDRPELVFILVTLCLDASEIQTWFVRRGRWSAYMVPESRMEELTQAEKAKLPASVDPEDAEFDARDEAEWVAFEEALHRWDARLLRVFPNRATSKRAHRPSGAEATPPPLGNYAKGRLDRFSARTKRDRFEELELVLLDDSRTNPVLAELFKVDETQKGTKSSTTAAGKPSGGPKRWSRGLRQCESRHWTQFAAELRRLLELMTKDPDRFVVVAAAHTNRFVQFASGEGNTRRGEAVGNHYLEVHEQLDRKTQAFLTRLGWKPPTTRQRNFSQAWPTSAGTRKPAAVAVRTLKEAFGIASPSSLEIKCETFS